MSDTDETTEGTTGQDLIERVMQPGGPGATTTTTKEVSDIATLQDACDQARECRVGMGVTAADEALLRRTVAASSGTDRNTNDAFLRFLIKHPEIAKDSVSRQAFSGLMDMSASMAQTDVATVPLSWALIAAIQAFDRQNARINDDVLRFLSQPLETKLAPGITVYDARVLLGEALKAAERQANQELARRGRHQRVQGQADTQVAQARTGAKGQQSVLNLKKRSKDATPVAIPGATGTTTQKAPHSKKGKTR